MSLPLLVFMHATDAATQTCDPTVLPFGRGILVAGPGVEDENQTYVQRYKGGDPVGSKHLLVDKTVAATFEVLCDGEYIAAWDWSDRGYLENYIYVRRLSSLGKPVGPEISQRSVGHAHEQNDR